MTLELLGDSWSLLVIRDLMFKGRRTFQEFLTAGEGIASNILSDRLLKLESNGIISKRRDTEDTRRFNYRLTEKGIGLAPLLVEVVIWAARHEETDAPVAAVKEMVKHRARVLEGIRKSWKESDTR